MELTRKLAQFVCDTQFNDIPETAVSKARECFLDWQGVALAGTGDPAAGIIMEYVRAAGGHPEASVIGSNIKTDMANAAMANGLIGHALDFDDYHDETVIHASAACTRSLVRCASRFTPVKFSGKEFSRRRWPAWDLRRQRP